ncbi:multidrug efflux SMR transporter [Paenibacillus sp. SC116]|uniref:DMT family transporter n=1 Tax=Paenibacillus sp. SC116 TaxID=2968986 RepID=UPI00215B3BD4|nr:multidrug efflux SMR transporter [Paenibacillus sp. SC116]MCR8845599.1 multidrug efflux SMR transporter [Paenibacillus sp. SC116]
MKGIFFLSLSIITEAVGTVMLKLSNGFTAIYPTLGFAICYLAAFTFLSFSLKTIPLSSAYATWSGIGTALAVILGIIFFQEEISMLKIVALLLVVVGIMMLNKGTTRSDQGSETADTTSKAV